MKYFLRKIKDSCFRALKGEEELWKVFWLWGVLIYLSAIPIGSFFFIIQKAFHGFSFSSVVFLISLLSIIVGILGQVFAFLYPIFFMISLWKCSKNSQHNLCVQLCKLYVPMYFLLHVFLFGLFSCWGGLLLMAEASQAILNIFKHLI